MQNKKNKNFTAKDSLKVDKRLTEVFIKLGVINKADVESRKSALIDDQEKLKSLKFEEIAKS